MPDAQFSAPIRVLIADDHTMVRNGLMMILGSYPDMELIGQAVNGHEAVELGKSLHPDVMLMDLLMPEMDGVAATAALPRSNPEIPIIALPSFKEDELIYAAMKAGIVGYLMKDCTAD